MDSEAQVWDRLGRSWQVHQEEMEEVEHMAAGKDDEMQRLRMALWQRVRWLAEEDQAILEKEEVRQRMEEAMVAQRDAARKREEDRCSFEEHFGVSFRQVSIWAGEGGGTDSKVEERGKENEKDEGEDEGDQGGRSATPTSWESEVWLSLSDV